MIRKTFFQTASLTLPRIFLLVLNFLNLKEQKVEDFFMALSGF